MMARVEDDKSVLTEAGPDDNTSDSSETTDKSASIGAARDAGNEGASSRPGLETSGADEVMTMPSAPF